MLPGLVPAHNELREEPERVAPTLLSRGDRKGGGVWYTPAGLARHLVAQTVAPSFRAHLHRGAGAGRRRPVAAAAELLDFAVLDPACGGGGFLVAALDELTDQAVRFLARTPLPAIGAAGDVTLLRRLLLERCVFGVDASPMGAEVAALSLRLAAPVPGLPPASLDRNLVVGDALVGVLRPRAVPPGYRRRLATRLAELSPAR